MNILAVDTALGACSAALLAHRHVLAHEHREMDRGHAEMLAPMVQMVMSAARCEFSALDRIAVTTGPGTFTGQRVGLAFARGLGLALKKPVIGVTTLNAMAQEALEKERNIPWAIAAADAKRGEIYLEAHSRAGKTLFAPALIPLIEIATSLGGISETYGRAAVLAGTAAEPAARLLEKVGLTIVDSLLRQPDAVFVAKLAALAPEGPPPKPLYLRAPDARLPGTLS